MYVETIGTFSPSIKSPIGATGLIQFTKSTAKGLGTTTSKLSKMTASEQLKFVDKYLSSFSGKMSTLEDAYMAVHYPVSVGKSNNSVVYQEGSSAYSNNRFNGHNNDGKVTKSEIGSHVRRIYNNRYYNKSNSDGVQEPSTPVSVPEGTVTTVSHSYSTF